MLHGFWVKIQYKTLIADGNSIFCGKSEFKIQYKTLTPFGARYRAKWQYRFTIFIIIARKVVRLHRGRPPTHRLCPCVRGLLSSSITPFTVVAQIDFPPTSWEALSLPPPLIHPPALVASLLLPISLVRSPYSWAGDCASISVLITTEEILDHKGGSIASITSRSGCQSRFSHTSDWLVGLAGMFWIC